jgi:hypothetical protein
MGITVLEASAVFNKKAHKKKISRTVGKVTM